MAEEIGLPSRELIAYVRDGLLVPDSPYDAPELMKGVMFNGRMQKNMRFDPVIVALVLSNHFGRHQKLCYTLMFAQL